MPLVTNCHYDRYYRNYLQEILFMICLNNYYKLVLSTCIHYSFSDTRQYWGYHGTGGGGGGEAAKVNLNISRNEMFVIIKTLRESLLYAASRIRISSWFFCSSVLCYLLTTLFRVTFSTRTFSVCFGGNYRGTKDGWTTFF